jgi:histidinol-phosphatase
VLERELAFAHDLADRAAEIAIAHFRGKVRTSLKPDGTPVTEVDSRIESMFREAVRSTFPADAIVGEEEGGTLEDGRTWIVDPIDGTKNFVAGVPLWATLISLADDGEPVLGVASSPANAERYEAVRGQGARLNGRPIGVSNTARLQDALVCHTGIEDWGGVPDESAFREVLSTARADYVFGDVSGHTMVATGAADVAVEPSMGLWDWAAPKVVVEEAGGRVSSLRGDPPRHQSGVVTTNGILHPGIVRLFRSG